MASARAGCCRWCCIFEVEQVASPICATEALRQPAMRTHHASDAAAVRTHHDTDAAPLAPQPPPHIFTADSGSPQPPLGFQFPKMPIPKIPIPRSAVWNRRHRKDLCEQKKPAPQRGTSRCRLGIASLQTQQFIETMDRNILESEAAETVCTQETLLSGDEPSIGMEFPNEESAYEFYNTYARKQGFSVRKSWIQRQQGVVIKRRFVCSKEGARFEREAAYHRAPTRINCPARMIIKLHKNGNYVVHEFDSSHNHEVVAPSKVHLLRSHRKKLDAKKDEASMVETIDTSTATTNVLSMQRDGDGNISFLPIDCRNYLHTKRMKEMERGDAGIVLEYFQKKQAEDPSFFYAFQLDVCDQITNIFWADTKSIVDYSAFGDVVCFDTTYRFHNFGRPFAPFVGVNHHKQTIIFGAALLYDETIESFKWLFETFLSAMCGKQPITILTDRSETMASAIATVLPNTSHRICAWHIFQNALKDLSNVFHGSRSFESDFGRCIYDYEYEDDFLRAWHDMLVKYELTENKWLSDLFEIKEKWASVYGKNTFCADMKNMQQSKSMNNVLKKYLSSQYDLLCFFKHYEKVITDCRYNEFKADVQMAQSIPKVFTNVKMLKEASMAYTPEVFEMFQEEYKEFLKLELVKCTESTMTSEFQVTRNESVRCSVAFDSSSNTVTCSCKKFEFMGILCSHALKVLDFYNVKSIPPQYILKRWHRHAKADIIAYDHVFETDGDSKEARRKRFNSFCRRMITLATISAEHDETFKFAEQYFEKFHDGVVECMKGIMELQHQSSKTSKKRSHGEAGPSPFDHETDDILHSQGIHQPSFQAPHAFPVWEQFN